MRKAIADDNSSRRVWRYCRHRTMQDMVEEIFGDIGDEYEDIVDEIQQIGDGEYIIDGLTRLTTLMRNWALILSLNITKPLAVLLPNYSPFPRKKTVVFNELK